jgi:small multidrug resistance family-3 protein
VLRTLGIAVLRTLGIYAVAAIGEIAGCYAVWVWLRRSGSPLWLIPAALCLVVFAVALTRIDAAFAGRAFAAYGGVYIVMSLVWLVVVERGALTRWDVAGAALCLAGVCVIVAGARG